MSHRRPARAAIAALTAASVLLTSGCGYLLYPERQGLKGGRIDPVVAVLDAVGLLFYIVPGVIAFAVDFTNGTIFLPPGGKSALDKHVDADLPADPRAEGWEAVPVAGELNAQNVARTLSGALGIAVDAAAIEPLPAG